MISVGCYPVLVCRHYAICCPADFFTKAGYPSSMTVRQHSVNLNDTDLDQPMIQLFLEPFKRVESIPTDEF